MAVLAHNDTLCPSSGKATVFLALYLAVTKLWLTILSIRARCDQVMVTDRDEVGQMYVTSRFAKQIKRSTTLMLSVMSDDVT